DNSTAENHCTIFAIAESPKNGKVLWVGTDDGNVQVTRDGGKTWSNVVANVPGLPQNTWVSSIQASGFDQAAAYATFDGHMTGDMKTYVYRTADYGKTWSSLATADLRGYAHVVREDFVNPNLLFLGTEFGLFASLDGGKQWGQFTAGLPNVAVRDVVIHPREQDLLIATHGRGIYIVDDITPLRKLTPEVLSAEVSFLESRPSVMVIPSFEFGFNGDGDFEGRSPAEAAAITYYLKRRHMFGDLKLEIYDAKGNLISTLPGGKRRGINRVFWPMRERPPKVPPAAGIIPSFFSLVGPRAPEGTYAVKLVKGKDSYASQVRLTPDPRARYSAEDRRLQQEIVRKLYVLMGKLTYTVQAITDARDQARARAEKLAKGDRLREQLETLADTLEKQRVALVATKEGEGISGEEKLREELGTLYGDVNGYDGRPTISQINRMGVLASDLDRALAKLEATAAKEFPAINALLARQKVDPMAKLTEEEWVKREEKR
ncbi:MAG TPA: glycosyl hydrolase, partial [Thermoanaerobaculia bacterium]|nr:glycosyl hydrolase [Thermoanaerobaculia bacterium]